MIFMSQGFQFLILKSMTLMVDIIKMLLSISFLCLSFLDVLLCHYCIKKFPGKIFVIFFYVNKIIQHLSKKSLCQFISIGGWNFSQQGLCVSYKITAPPSHVPAIQCGCLLLQHLHGFNVELELSATRAFLLRLFCSHPRDLLPRLNSLAGY